MLAEGKLSIGAMITHEFEWSELPEVYSRLDKGDTDILGAIIRWR
jgi:threonine dehydrogenase-like Zn-dependent dehydrogenase